jgi:hypothetical protein
MAAAVALACALACGVFVHAGVPAARRLAIAATNRALADAFRGRVEVLAVGRLGVGSIEDLAASVRDEEGRTVAVAEGVSARIAWLALASAVVHGRGDLPIVVTRAHARSIDATLVRGAGGEPTLVHAFDPRHPVAGESSRVVRIDVRELRLDRLRVHGQIGPFDSLAASASAVRASFAHDRQATTAQVQKLDLEVSGVSPQPVTATVKADLALRGTHREAAAIIEARLGDVPMTLGANVRGDRLDATLDVPQAAPGASRRSCRV